LINGLNGWGALVSKPFDQLVEEAHMTYTHLSQTERYQIYVLLKAGQTQT
jgi:hypothetical protein